MHCLRETGQELIVQHLTKDAKLQAGEMPGYVPAYEQQQPSSRVYGRIQPCKRAVSHPGYIDNMPQTLLTPEIPRHREIAPEPVPVCDIMEVERKIRNMPCDHGLPRCTPEWMKRKCQEEECYPVRHTTRGRAIVITMTGDRDGWDSDVLNLAKLFKYLEFDVEWHYDLKYEDYINKLERFAQSDKNSHVDCAWVIMMGHGGNLDSKDYVISRDAKPVYIRYTIEKIFNNRICLTLQQKPKAFIVQMCRGDIRDHGVVVQKNRVKADAGSVVKMGTFTDYLFGYATQEGHQALRDINTGSWYIEKLVQIFMEKARHTTVTEMLVEVNREVQNRESDQGDIQTSQVLSTLSRRFYLFPGVNPT